MSALLLRGGRSEGGTLPLFGMILAFALVSAGCGREDPAPLPDADTVPAVPDDRYDPADPDDPPAPDPDPRTDPRPAEPDPDPADPPVEKEPGDDPADGPRTEEGIVGVTGTDAWSLAVLRTDAGRSIGLTGDLEPEIRRLGGIRVRIVGTPAATPVGPGIEVTEYRLLDVEGQTPHLGVLERDEDDGWVLRTREDEDVRITALPDRIREGTLIWVVGRTEADGRVAVERYGVVAEPEQDPPGA